MNDIVILASTSTVSVYSYLKEKQYDLPNLRIYENNVNNLLRVFGSYYISVGEVSKIKENYFCYKLLHYF